MRFSEILGAVEHYYDEKIAAHGATAAGVDWNSSASQEMRFAQLLKVCDTSEHFSINDFGCGYGALVDYMEQGGYSFEYRGYDISEGMIKRAETFYRDREYCKFLTAESDLRIADYTVASGIFNVKLHTDESRWRQYIDHTLAKISEVSAKGFAFNVLTSYSDKERMRPYLYYADPSHLFNYCKRTFSRYVAVLHDYPLYEFTIIVRKER